MFDRWTDWPWEHGQLVLDDAGMRYRDLFALLVDDHPDALDRVPASFLDERNWSVRRTDRTTQGISVPAVHADGGVAWRWS